MNVEWITDLLVTHLRRSCLFPTAASYGAAHTPWAAPAAPAHVSPGSPPSAAVAGHQWSRAQLSRQFSAETRREKRTCICQAPPLAVTIICSAPPRANTHSMTFSVNTAAWKQPPLIERGDVTEGQHQRGKWLLFHDIFLLSAVPPAAHLVMLPFVLFSRQRFAS